MSNFHAAIRAFVAAAGKPCTPNEIAAGLPRRDGDTPFRHYRRVASALGVLEPSGMLVKAGRGLYETGRPLKQKPKATPEEARQRKQERAATPASKRASTVLTPASPLVTQVAPARPRFETSEEWMARTGGKPEVVPPTLQLKPWEPLPKNRKKAA